MTVEAVAKRVQAEFEEMPGLSLTEHQAAKLFGIERDMCRHVIDRLIDSSYLRKTRTGSIARRER